MDPILGGALISGGAALIGGLMSQQGQTSANKSNTAEAARNRKWQEHMSSTAHQRQVEDLRKAGLNPILSANSGASTPSGAMAVAQNTMEGLQQSASEIAQAALNYRRQKSEIALLEAQTRKTSVDAKVAEKGIPESEAKMGLWEFFKEKLKENSGSNAPAVRGYDEKTKRFKIDKPKSMRDLY